MQVKKRSKMKEETVDRILADLEEVIEKTTLKSSAHEDEYLVGHYDGQVFGLAYAREMIKAHWKGEKRNG